MDALRRSNRAEIVRVLSTEGPMGQAELARRTGLSRTTVSSAVAELRNCALVTEEQATSTGIGRPSPLLALDRSAGAVAGIDIGHHHLRLAVADLGRTVLARWNARVQVYDNAEGTLRQAAEALANATTSAGVRTNDLLGVGVSLPGPMDRGRSGIGPTTVLPGWSGLPVAERLTAELGVPVHADNDAAVGALAESHLGTGQQATTFAFVKAGSGLGAGLVLDGRVFRGSGGSAGELGHIVVDPGGRFCYCGNRGCLQTVASGQALVHALSDVYGADLTVPGVVDRCLAGDRVAQRAIEDAGTQIGIGLAQLCNLMNPELIVVGGQLSRTGETLLAPLRRAARRGTIQSAASVHFELSQLGAESGMLGALCLVPVDAHALVDRHLPAPDRGDADG